MKHFFKRIWLKYKRGFDCCDTWSLQFIFAKYLAKGLKAYKEDCTCYPAILTFEQWKEILDKMIWSFEYCDSDDYWDDDLNTKRESKKRRKQYQEGLNLFAKYFNDLWR